jgi:hypothetical protein
MPLTLELAERENEDDARFCLALMAIMAAMPQTELWSCCLLTDDWPEIRGRLECARACWVLVQLDRPRCFSTISSRFYGDETAVTPLQGDDIYVPAAVLWSEFCGNKLVELRATGRRAREHVAMSEDIDWAVRQNVLRGVDTGHVLTPL